MQSIENIRSSLVFLIIFCLVCPGMALANQWANWEWINPLPQGITIQDVSYGDGVIVSVGYLGTILCSENAADWDIVHSGKSYALRDIVWTGSFFVAVGGAKGNIMLRSDSGREWIETQQGGGKQLWAVEWNGEQVLAVGEGGVSWTSPDGFSWERHDFSEDLDIPIMFDVAWNGSAYVAVGAYPMGYSESFYSEDGINWSIIDMGDIDIASTGFTITVAEGQFAAPSIRGDGAYVNMFSDNGLQWVDIPMDVPWYLYDIDYKNGQFAAISWDFFALSEDGITWQIFGHDFKESLLGLEHIGDQYLLWGDSGYLTTTVDGTQWQDIGLRVGGRRTGNFEDIVLGEAGYVGITSAGYIFKSSNGIDWTEEVRLTVGAPSIRWLKDAYWCAGDYGLIATSTDGEHWEEKNIDTDVSFFDMASNGSLLMAVGWKRGESWELLFATSDNGNEWDYQLIENVIGPLQAAVWAGDRFVVAGARGHMLTSVDGFSWSIDEFGEEISFRAMEWNGELIVAVGGVTQTGGLIATSRTGLDWDLTVIPDIYFDKVTWTGQYWVIVGDYWILTSRDGHEWKREKAGFGVYPKAVVGVDSELLIGGQDCAILRAVHSSSIPRRGNARYRSP